MPLSSRKHPRHKGIVNEGRSEEPTEYTAHQSDPLSVTFVTIDTQNTKEIVRLLIATQASVYNTTIQEEFKRPILMRHAKSMLKKYSSGAIHRGIVLASRTSNVPYTFKYVEKLINDYQLNTY